MKSCNCHPRNKKVDLSAINALLMRELTIRPVAGRDRHVLFFFMPRFTSSRSWQTVLSLGRVSNWLQARMTEVVLVGDGQTLGPARKFACENRLPFRVISDDNDLLGHLFGLRRPDRSQRRPALVLVDKKGRMRFCQGAASSGTRLEIAELMAAVEAMTSESVASCLGSRSRAARRWKNSVAKSAAC